MKKAFVLFLAVALLGGCSPSESVASHPEKTTPPPTATSTPPVKTSPDSATQQKVDPNLNPNRQFQLKDLSRKTIQANGKKIPVWIMDTEPKRAEGMMWLRDEDVPDEVGMLFVFPKDQTAQNGFWMHNTRLALDIVYIDPKGKVGTIKKGEPFDETSLLPTGPYRFVLELKQGEAAKLGIKPGTIVSIPSQIVTKE